MAMTGDFVLGRPQRGAPGGVLAAASAEPTPILDDGGFDTGVYVVIDERVLASVDGGQVVANGNAALTFLDPCFDGALDEEGALASFQAAISLSGALTLELRVDGAGRIDDSIPLPVLALPSLTFGSVVVTPTFSASITCSGTAAARGCVSVIAPFKAEVNFGARDQPAVALVLADPELGRPDAHLDLDLQVGLEVSLTFMVAIDGVLIGGPALTGTLAVGVHAALLPAPEWSVGLETALSAGWALFPGAPVTDTVLEQGYRTLVTGALPAVLPPSRWSRVYDFSDTVTAAGIVTDGEGAVLMSNSDLNAWPWMAAVDGGGTPTFQYSAAPVVSNGMNVKSLIRLSDGDLLATGWSAIGGGMRVQRYDRLGRAVWARSMLGPAATHVFWNASVATPSGGAILVGGIDYYQGVGSRGVVAEIQGDGTIAWMTEVELGAGATEPTLNAVALTSAGEILAVGTVRYADVPTGDEPVLNGVNGLVLRLAADGASASAFAVGGSMTDEVTTLALFPDDAYAIGGYSSTPRGSDLNRSWVACFGPDDALRWSGTYAGEDAASWAHVNALAALPGQGLLVAAGDGHPETTGRAWLFRLGAKGEVVWFKSFDGSNNDTLSHLLALEDGLIALGHTRSVNDTSPSPLYDLWVVRTSRDGMLKLSEASGVKTRNDVARWKRSSPVVRPLPSTLHDAVLTSSVPVFEVIAGTATTEILT